MQEVVNKIKELYSLLEEKLVTTEKLNQKLALDRKEIEVLEGKSIAKLKRVSAMERIYQKYVDFDKEKTEFESKRNTHVAVNEEAAEKLKEADKRIKEADNKTKANENELKTISRQMLALKEKETKFKKTMEDAKKVLTGESLKEIFK